MAFKGFFYFIRKKYSTMDNVLISRTRKFHFPQNFEPYCEMVHSARQVNVEHSMSKRSWTSEEFHHVLSTHTEMVIILIIEITVPESYSAHVHVSTNKVLKALELRDTF